MESLDCPPIAAKAAARHDPFRRPGDTKYGELVTRRYARAARTVARAVRTGDVSGVSEIAVRASWSPI